MEQVLFCRHCGELLNHQWFHCPWCGHEVVHHRPDWETVVDDSLGRIEESEQQGRILRLDHLAVRLDALESELDAFLDEGRKINSRNN